ncbi:MAG: DNA primase [Candidatus Diapherotrites archaeon]|nr:DNA primase [Candidatus Diapherotrites archaeon]
MGKTYIDTVKYVIKGKVEIDGIVEKPDIVGAIFGQTEGLLGEDLDLRELQKSGRIGRIEVTVETKSGKTIGHIIVPSSLDRAETSIIAAALETVDRVGPCTAKITVEKIEDTRSTKRQFVVQRAKELLEKMEETIPESKEISEKVRAEAKMAELQEYGREKLAAGPDIDTSEEIIVVEGRADVLNLLSYGIKNVIALSGQKIPRTVVELAKKKQVTAFVDGDRGGDMVVAQLVYEGAVDYVAKAPDGKEVEELTKKEIIKCLRNKMPVDRFLKQVSSLRIPIKKQTRRPEFRKRRQTQRTATRRREKYRHIIKPEDERLLHIYDGLKGSMMAALVNKNNEVIAEVPVAEMIDAIKNTKGIYAVVFDGIITQRLVELADSKGIAKLVGLKQAKISKPKKVKTIVVGASL